MSQIKEKYVKIVILNISHLLEKRLLKSKIEIDLKGEVKIKTKEKLCQFVF